MSNAEHVKTIREEQRQKFGNVGLKKDCEYYGNCGYNSCRVCSYVWDGRFAYLPCERKVCYFYKSKEEKGDNE